MNNQYEKGPKNRCGGARRGQWGLPRFAPFKKSCSDPSIRARYGPRSALFGGCRMHLMQNEGYFMQGFFIRAVCFGFRRF